MIDYFYSLGMLLGDDSPLAPFEFAWACRICIANEENQ